MLRSKVRWVESGEKNTKYFFALEKQRSKAKVTTATFTESGSLTRNPKVVLKIQAAFYN